MKLPQEVQTILGVFRCFGQEIYLVGGAVRDHVLGKEIRDYDLALRMTDDKDIDELKILASRLGLQFGMLCKPEYGGLCVKLWNNSIDIEVMGYSHESIHDRIAEFPVNVSKVYLDENGTVQKHADFVEFEETRVLHFDFTNSGGDQDKQDTYELKIRRKFD